MTTIVETLRRCYCQECPFETSCLKTDHRCDGLQKDVDDVSRCLGCKR